MSASFEKAVKGGTKIKLAAPKAKYVETILVATHAGEGGVAEVFRTLQHRLRDSTWTIVFKALIVTHLMIREGEPSVTLKYLADSPSKLDTGSVSEVQAQGSNIRHYTAYLLARVKSYRDTKIDWVKDGQGRLKRQTIDKGLLRETESVQQQIAALLKCDLLSNEPENEISLTAFRLLTMDLLILNQVMNEGTINVLEHYFEMSKFDAERALAIYKTFSKQTNKVLEFLSVARQHESATRLEIPKLKHAPTGLTASLEEYLNDPDFEINRRQYLAQQEAKRTGKKVAAGGSKAAPTNEFSKLSLGNNTTKQGSAMTNNASQATSSQSAPKAPAPDLIDFFESIEQTQPPLPAVSQESSGFHGLPQFQFQQQQPQPQQQFLPQQSFAPGQPQPVQQPNGSFGTSNPFGQVSLHNSVAQPNFSGGALNGYGQQPQQSFNPNQTNMPHELSNSMNMPQDNTLNFAPQQNSLSMGQQPQSVNPFRQSVMPHLNTGTTSPFTTSPPITSSLNRQSTNPFARSINTQQTGQSQGTPFSSPFTSQPPQSALSATGTGGPFFTPPPIPTPDNISQNQFAAQPLQPARTGTNPFARTSPPPQISTNPFPQPNSAFSSPSPLVANSTGSTNPFRKSTFGQPGQGWQVGQGTMGGLENLETIPVFPRPGQQQTQAWP